MTARQDNFQQAMNQGHSAAWDGRWDRAEVFYRQALEADPQSPVALTNLGLALIELQEYEEALKCYQRAARLAAEDPLPLEKIAQLSERLGNLDLASQAAFRAAELYIKNRDVLKAIENWERVTRLNPENLLAYSRLALVYTKLGEKHKAVSAYLSLASLQQSSGDPTRALQSIQRALEILPGNEEAQQALALLRDFKPLPKPTRPRGGTAPLRMSQVRQLQTAQDASQPTLDPISAARQKALTVLAGMLFDTADDESDIQQSRLGLQALVSGASSGSRPLDRTRMVLHLSQVVDLQTRGEEAQAAEELQRAVELGLDHSAAAFDLGYLYARIGRLESALRHLQASVKNPDFSLGAHLLIAELLHKKGQIKEAALEFLESLKLADAAVVDPARTADLLQLYDLLIDSQRFQNDPAALQRICDNVHDMLNRSDWRERLYLARQQLPGMDRSDPPIPLAEVLVEARSSHVIGAVSSIYEMMEHGQLRSAMEEAFYALDDAPTYLPLHALMAELQTRNGNPSAAIEKYQVIARTYAMRGDAQQAVNYARRVIELSPTDMKARKDLITLLVSLGKAETAVEEYIQLAEVYYSLADLALARKSYTDALQVAQQTNVDRSLRVKLLQRMADIDKQSLEWRQALRLLEQIRTLQPDSADVRSEIIALSLRLGQESQAIAELDNFLSYLNSNQHPDRAVSYLEDLVTEYPESVAMRRRLAETYRHAGRVEDAILQLDAIGDLFLQANDRSAAIQTIETIIALNPANRDEYLQLLEQVKRG